MQHRVIAVLNQKGGVGKTTTSCNLAFALSQMEKHVLAIDLDPQSHLAVSLGLNQAGLSGVDDIFLDGAEAAAYVHPIRENLDILPAGFRLGEVEKLSAKGRSQAVVIRDALLPIRQNYDFVIIDCPPTSGLLNFNALYACDEIVIPVSSDYLALQGLSQFLKTLESAQSYMGKSLKIWIVLTRFMTRRNLSQTILTKLLQYFPKQILATVVRECAPVAESPGYGQSVIEYRPKSNGAKDYLALANDICEFRTLEAL